MYKRCAWIAHKALPFCMYNVYHTSLLVHLSVLHIVSVRYVRTFPPAGAHFCEALRTLMNAENPEEDENAEDSEA